VPLFYVDTSALVKRYHVELGSDQVDRLFADPDASLVTANLAITELTSALDRKCQDGALTHEGLTQILAVAAQDLLAEFWLLELDRTHIRRSQPLILRHHLRTLDALHLAVVLSIKELHPVLVSADVRLLQAADREGIELFNPETFRSA
jgi:predicted nucleic acid-binding protein